MWIGITPALANQYMNCFQKLAALTKHSYYYNQKTELISQVSFKGIKSFGELEQTYGGFAFFDLQYWLPHSIIQENNRIVRELIKPQPAQSHQGVSAETTSLIYQRMLGRQSVLKEEVYDHLTQNGCIKTGFCFGRATIAHMESIIENVPSEYIKKIWVVGEMQEWTFHVATMIKTNGKWMVLDNKVGLMNAKRWMAEMRKRLITGKQMFFVSQPTRFGVNSPNQYNAVDLFGRYYEEDFYQGYFREYFNEISESVIQSQ